MFRERDDFTHSLHVNTHTRTHGQGGSSLRLKVRITSTSASHCFIIFWPSTHVSQSLSGNHGDGAPGTLPACVDVAENERFYPAEEEVADLCADIKGSGNNGVVTPEEACFVTRGPRVSVDVWGGSRPKSPEPR